MEEDELTKDLVSNHPEKAVLIFKNAEDFIKLAANQTRIAEQLIDKEPKAIALLFTNLDQIEELGKISQVAAYKITETAIKENNLSIQSANVRMGMS